MKSRLVDDELCVYIRCYMKSDLAAKRSHEIREGCIGLRLRMLNRVVNTVYEKELAPYGLTIGQLNIMTVLVQVGPVSPVKIVEFMRVEKSTLSRNLKVMEEAGWILCKGQGRGLIVEPTKDGRRVYVKGYRGWKKAQTSIERTLAKEGVGAVQTLFSKLGQFGSVEKIVIASKLQLEA